MARTLRVPVVALQSGLFELGEEAAHYVRRVLRCRLGDPVVLFDPEQRLEARARLATLTSSQVLCEVEPLQAAERTGFVGLSLVLSLGKGDKPEDTLRAVVALGVERITFLSTAHSVVRVEGRELHKLERLHKIAVAAARQSLRGDLPTVEGPLSWSEHLHSIGANAAIENADAGPVKRVVLHTQGASPPLLSLLEAIQDQAAVRRVRVELWLGPEGGFSDAEFAELQALGAEAASLGPLIQRAELAAVSACAIVGAWGLARGLWAGTI